MVRLPWDPFLIYREEAFHLDCAALVDHPDGLASVAASYVPLDASLDPAWEASEAFGASSPLDPDPSVDLRNDRLEVVEASLDLHAYLACPSEERGNAGVVVEEDHVGDLHP